MIHTYSAGGVVINTNKDIAVVSQQGTSWSLPKGQIDPGEDALMAAKREIQEETGIEEIELVRELATYDRFRTNYSGNGVDENHLKTITMFLFTTEHTEPLHPPDPANPEARWVPIGDVSALLTNQKDKEFFESIKHGLR